MRITVGIPAHNESASIGALLEQLCGEDCNPHALVEVLVYDDCSTDATAALVADCAKRWPAVRLIRGARRIGCTAAFNVLCANATGDVFVKIDADTALLPGALRSLADAIENGASMAFGAAEPSSGRMNIVGRGALFAGRVVEELERGALGLDYNGARLIAIATDAVKRARLPDDLISKEHYLLLAMRREQARVAFVPSARCRYLVPTTFADYWKQSRRILEGERQLRRRYGSVPGSTSELVRAVLHCAVRSPLAALYWAAIYSLSYVRRAPASGAIWPVSATTKGPIAVGGADAAR